MGACESLCANTQTPDTTIAARNFNIKKLSNRDEEFFASNPISRASTLILNSKMEFNSKEIRQASFKIDYPGSKFRLIMKINPIHQPRESGISQFTKSLKIDPRYSHLDFIRSWKRARSNKSSTIVFNIPPHPTTRSSEINFKKILTSSSQLRALKIRSLFSNDATPYLKILDKHCRLLRGLKTLFLQINLDSEEEDESQSLLMLRILARLPELTSLEVKFPWHKCFHLKHFPDILISCSNFQKLQKLSLLPQIPWEGSINVMPRVIMDTMAFSIENLRSIKTFCFCISAELITYFSELKNLFMAISKLEQLENLVIFSRNAVKKSDVNLFEEESWRSFKRLKNLKNLYINYRNSYLPNINGLIETLEHLASLINLRLDFYAVPNFESLTLDKLAQVLFSSGKIKNLNLTIDGCNHLLAEGIMELSKVFLNLDSIQKLTLSFSECKNMTNKDLQNIFVSLWGLRNLKELSFESKSRRPNHEIDHRPFFSMGKSLLQLPNLEKLSIISSSLTEEAFTILIPCISHLSELKELKIKIFENTFSEKLLMETVECVIVMPALVWFKFRFASVPLYSSIRNKMEHELRTRKRKLQFELADCRQTEPLNSENANYHITSFE